MSGILKLRFWIIFEILIVLVLGIVAGAFVTVLIVVASVETQNVIHATPEPTPICQVIDEEEWCKNE